MNFSNVKQTCIVNEYLIKIIWNSSEQNLIWTFPWFFLNFNNCIYFCFTFTGFEIIFLCEHWCQFLTNKRFVPLCSLKYNFIVSVILFLWGLLVEMFLLGVQMKPNALLIRDLINHKFESYFSNWQVAFFWHICVSPRFVSGICLL